jgi:YbbR domain-containing protein
VLLSFLKRDLGLKILCILLAATLWAYVKYTSTPQFAIASEVKVNVPLTFENTSENLIALDAPDEITLVIQGNPQTLSQVKPANFGAHINLKDRKSGVYNLPVKITTPPDVKVLKVEPANIHFSLNPLAKQIFTVNVRPNGTASPGFVLSAITSQPESVTVSGPKKLLDEVKEVRAVCDIDGADMDIVQRVKVDVIDKNDRILDDLRVEPRFVRTSIRIRSEVVNRTIPISPDVTGNPAEGYKMGKITLIPASAVVRYHNEMENPPTLLKTESVSIEGAKDKIIADVGLVVPAEVSLVDLKLVKVQIQIIPIKNY